MSDAPSAAAGFGRLVRSGRCDAGLTQDELAARTGLGQSTLSEYESGNREPSLSNAVRIAEAVGVSIDDLAAPFRSAPLITDRSPRKRRPMQVAS